METKICLRSGYCCSGYLAIVPKYEHSDLSPEAIEKVPVEQLNAFMEEHTEPMGEPCKWLVRDEQTTEATCLAHNRKSEICLNYPESISQKKEYCNNGLFYWKNRRSKGLPIPNWVAIILESL